MSENDDRYSKLNEMYEQMEEDFISASEAEATKKIDRRNLIVLISIIVVLLVLAAALIPVYLRLGTQDKLKIAKAFTNLSEDINSSKIMSVSDEEDIINAVMYGNTTTTVNYNVAGIPNVPVTLGVDGFMVRSFDTQKQAGSCNLSVMNSRIASADVYIDGTKLYLKVPQLFDYNMLVDLDGLAENFNKSMLANVTGASLDNDLKIEPFGDGVKREIHITDTSELLSESYDTLSEIVKNMEVSHDRGNIDFTLQDGSVIPVKTYHVTISSADVQRIKDEYVASWKADREANLDKQDIYELSGQSIAIDEKIKMLSDIETQNDLKLEILIDKDYQVRNIRTEEALLMDKEAVDITMTLSGNDRSYDDCKLNVLIEDKSDKGDNQPQIYDVHRVEEANGRLAVDFICGGKTNMTVEYVGAATYEDNTLSLDITTCDATYQGEELFRSSGHISITSGIATIPAAPNDKILDVLNLDIMDMIGLAGELEGALETIQEIGNLI